MIKRFILAGLVVLAIAASVFTPGEAQDVLYGGCYPKLTTYFLADTALVTFGYRAEVGKKGGFEYGNFLLSSTAQGHAFVFRIRHTSNTHPTQNVVVAANFFGPGEGFAEYVYFDSMMIIKTVASDTINYGGCDR